MQEGHSEEIHGQMDSYKKSAGNVKNSSDHEISYGSLMGQKVYLLVMIQEKSFAHRTCQTYRLERI